ncbi:AcrR family transcriptional regulator [Geomicrobium halophilum]|uniref:AcrR family transcriptional regulator n=1 Tax=Geomicrobium halophilum TaxID=549000 RepID=A0A841PR12_9BACL|nr:TetR family transcriptional regulator [Geomicrobium halophilum]MBB6448731.1 AcrR family transcriptional regulator [Geomicrobium halophilum]
MDKKEKIVHAAIEVFREKGIEKTKVSDIVQIVGIAQGTFYLYFPSKLSVMPAIAEVMVEKMMDEMKRHVQEHAPFQVQMEEIIEVVYNLTKEYPDVFALIYAGLTQTDYLKEWEAIYAPLYEWMNELLDQAKASGIIRHSLHTERTTKMIIGLIESTAEQVYLYDDCKQEETVRLQKQELLEFISHALGLHR